MSAGNARWRRWCAAFALALSVSSVVPVAGAQEGHVALLHALFQDHVVLQRDRPIRIWGNAEPNAEVRVALAGQRAIARADGTGTWEAALPAMPAGGPHVLTAASGGATQSIDDVLVGDVWLCSGQSNMELQVWRSLDARAEIEGAHAPATRLFTVPQHGSATPEETFATPASWRTVTPDTLRDFSAACFYFARDLHKTVDVPMGLISAAWGGARIQAWIGSDALRKLDGYDEGLDVLALYARDPLAAAARWGEAWQRWWLGRDGIAAGDEPWNRDADAGAGTRWRDAPRDLGPWEGWGVPELAAFDGVVWYRTHVRLGAAQAAQAATLALGAIDETDMTWVNGRAVGSAYGPGSGREYPLPQGLLREGDNTIAIAVLDTYRGGGLAAPASAHALRFADGSSAPLDRGWKYRIVPGTAWPPDAPWQTSGGLSTLHNGMIEPLGRFGLRGALWYQGESNTNEPARYADLLRALRGAWRSRFGAGLPLLVVQLAGYGTPATAPAESGWAQLREAQRQVAAEDRATGLVVAIDIGDRYDVHPPNKQELGRRLARAARRVAYGEALSPSGPVPRWAAHAGDTVEVSFGDVANALVAYGARTPIGFELCGAAAGSCRYADAMIRGADRVVLRAPVPDATRVRYGWADSPVVNLFDGDGLPAGPFELRIAGKTR